MFAGDLRGGPSQGTKFPIKKATELMHSIAFYHLHSYDCIKPVKVMKMINLIKEIISLNDDNVEIIDYEETADSLVIILRSKKTIMMCPNCNTRMRSKGIERKVVNHPVMQNGKRVVLQIMQRKWHCPNVECNCYTRDTFNFIEPMKRNTTLVPFAILNDLKDINLSAKQVAEKNNVSDTYVHSIFMRYVDLPRLPLGEIISIDEVYMKFNNQDKYALVIIDFTSGEIIDILPNRLEKDTSSYFLSIPLSERKRVKYLVCDMYKSYLNYPKRFFPNATLIIDSFHVIQLFTKAIVIMLNKKASDIRQKIDVLNKKEVKRYADTNEIRRLKDDLYILHNFRWVLLKNKDDIEYSDTPRFNQHFKQYLTTKQLEFKFFELDKHYEEIRDLKELYIRFNKKHVNDLYGAAQELRELIEIYQDCNYSMFKRISQTLNENFDAIVNSFTYIENAKRKTRNDSLTRVSNGLMECNNNVFKNYKRQSKGVENFPYTRNRVLWATRTNPAMRAVPKDPAEVKSTGKPRGKYNKKK